MAVRRRTLATEAWVRTRVSPCGIFVDNVVLGQVFSGSSVSPVSIIPPWFSMLIYHLGDQQ
jgi:hypothetical protein